MGKPSNRKAIEERREKILMLLARGYSQYQVTQELNISRQIISHDMRAINEMTKKGLFGLAKETLTTMYYNCIQGIEQVQKEAWKIYKNEDNDPTITNWHKMTALRLLKDTSESKFSMFTGAPAIMGIDHLENDIIQLRKNVEGDKYKAKPFSRLPYYHIKDRNLDIANLDTDTNSDTSTTSSNDSNLDK